MTPIEKDLQAAVAAERRRVKQSPKGVKIVLICIGVAALATGFWPIGVPLLILGLL